MIRQGLPLAAAALCILGCHGTRPDVVGRGKGTLAPCPSTPNCVNTHASDSTHAIEPLTYEGDASDAMTRLVAVIEGMDRTEIITKSEGYLYVEFTSAFWRFVDDVEFSFDTTNKVIHFRSASRLGRSDFGVNRKRMEEVRRRFNARGSRAESGT
ncbi:MAG: DUF1499 domain-containing protein [Chitinivibrionales bacterium]|nr:DUF1499 domain-containing protein [Chitinivibrionales bacterium]